MFWSSLFITASAFLMIWSFMVLSWTQISAFLKAEIQNIESYKPVYKYNSSLEELKLP